MAGVPLVVAAIVLLWSPLAAAAPRTADVAPAIPADLTVALSRECSAGGEVLEIAKREAALIWSLGGVELRWVDIGSVPYRSAKSEWLVVQCVDGADVRMPEAGGRTVAIAAIRFIGSQPLNTIMLSVENATALMAREQAEARDMSQRFAVLRELRLGRLLGRAVAHEIGHFLTQSGAHSARGLMRASHTLTALTAESRYPFSVAGVAVVAAPARLSAAPAASASPGPVRDDGRRR